MKEKGTGVLIFLLSLALSVSVTAEEVSYRVGFWYLPGYHEQSSDGDRSGYGYDYMEKIVACMGGNIQYVGYDKSWAELMGMLERGEIDILTNATRTPERERRFDYADRPIGLSFTILTVKAGDTRYSLNDYAHWNGMKVGMIRESSRNEQFATFAAKKGFRFVPVVYPTYNELESALANGTVDALLSTNSRRTKDEWILEKINPDPVYIIVRKGNTKLLDSVNRALSLLEINAPNLNETLMLRYYSVNIAKRIPLTKEEAEFIEETRAKHRVFRALIKPDRAPLCEYRNGEMRGIFREIADLVHERSKLDIEIVPCRSREEYDEKLRREDYDIIFDAWRNYPHLERHDLYLTEPYFVCSLSLLQLKKGVTKTGRKGVFKNSWLLNELHRRGEDISNLQEFETCDKMISAILNGTIDFGYMSTPMAARAIRSDHSALMTSTLIFGFQTEYVIGIKRSLSPELIRIVGKTVRSISNDDLQQIVSAYDVLPGRGVTIRDWVALNPLKTVFVAVFVLISVVGTLMFIILSRRRMYRTGKVITQLPVRFLVSDREENVLLYNVPDLHVKRRQWLKITDLDSPDMTDIISRTVCEAFEKGICTVNYVHRSTRRTARAERLSSSIFGRETVIWISQNTEELQSSREQLQLAVEKAQNAEKAKSFFLATMSHEIRTPLNAVIGFAELLKNVELSPSEQKDYLNDVAFAGNALLALINDVLDFSKLEAGQMEFVSEQTDFLALLHEVATIFMSRCHEKGLTISVEEEVMPYVFLDRLRIRQILFNLIGNAVKFTNHGGIVVTASFIQDKNEKNGTLTFSVKDTGCGISAADQQNLFQPFVQSKAMRGTQAANNGTGLGLAIVRNMVLYMNGDLTLKSVPKEGSTFTVTLRGIPFKKVDRALSLPEVEKPQVSIEKKSILLVDDVVMNLKVESVMLKKIGMDVFTVSNAADALKQLETQSFDYLLTDMWMPDMNGDELARKVHSNPRFAHLKIIAVTADTESQSNFDMSIFTQILTKPITLDKLRNLF